MRRRRALAVVSVVATATLAGAVPARATIRSQVDGGVLTIRGDGAGDMVVVSCPSGDVIVNFSDPDSGPVTCDAITSIDIATGAGDDRISLDAVDPSAFIALTSVRVDGGDGIDTIVDTPLDDVLIGGPGVDYFVHVGGSDRIDGGSEADQLTLSVRSDVTASDQQLVAGGDVLALSSIERLRVTGTGRGLRIDASRFHGTSEFSTDAGRDVLIGGPGNDVLSSGGGADRLVGNSGNDKLTGGPGDDVLLGGAGIDFLYGGPGHDRCNSGPGGGPGQECETS